MKKRIKYLLCAFIIIMLSAVCHAADVEEENAVKVLNSLSIIRGEIYDISTDEILTRGDAAVWIYNMLGSKAEYDYSVFEDVTPGTKTANAITALYSMKIVSGDGKLFRPDDAITRNELFTMLCNTIGYSELAARYGEYPTGVINIMAKLGVSGGVGGDASSLTVGTAARYVLNALKANAFEFSIHDDAVEYAQSEKMVMNELLDLYMIEGRVEANSLTSLYNPDGGMKNSITIGETTYRAGIDGADDLLGLYIEAYIHKNDDDAGTVVAAVCDEKKYTELKINASDISDSSTRTNIIYDDGDKVRSENINVTADIIYNGVAYPDAAVSEIYPDFGEVRLIDRDNNDEFDIVFVTAYSAVVAENVDIVRRKVTNKYKGEGFDDEIVLSEDDEVEIADNFGEPMEFSDISENTIVFVAKPKSGKADRYKMFISQKTAKGKVSSVDTEEGSIIAGDEEYELSDAIGMAVENKCLAAVEPGKEYILYFDMNDKVFFYDKLETGARYGYIKNAYVSEEDEETVFVKMFCDDGTWNLFEVRERIICDGSSAEAKDYEKTAVLDEIVKYELDAEGRLRMIDYPITTYIEDPALLTYAKEKEFTKAEILNERWLLNTVSFEGKFYTGAVKLVFNVPGNGNESEFSVSSSVSFVSEARYTLTMYDMDEFCYGAVIKQTATDNLGLNYLDNLMVVDEVIYAHIDDETVSVVSGYMNGNNVSFTGKEKSTFEGLKRGDVIRTKYNNGARATGYYLVHTFGNEEEITSVSTWSDIPSAGVIKAFASDVDYSGRRIRINDVLDGITYAIRSNTIITVYDSINEEVKNGTINDLAIGDYIILRLRGGEFLELLIVKK